MPTPLLDNRQLGPDTARDNLLTNGGLENWQRGTGPFTSTAGVGCADCWFSCVQGSGPTISISRDTTNQDAGSQTCAAVTAAGAGYAAGTNFLYLQSQKVNEAPAQLGGRTLSFSVRVRCATPNAVRLAAFYSGAFHFGPAYHSGSGAYETLTYTFTWPAGTAAGWVMVCIDAASTAYLDNAMLVVGSQPANYAPMHPADDLARCLRYYEIIGAVGGNDVLIGGYAGGAGGIAWMPFNFKAVKAVTPTMTKNGTWALNNSSTQPILPTNSVNGFSVQLTGTAAGSTTAQNSAAGCNITAESNP